MATKYVIFKEYHGRTTMSFDEFLPLPTQKTGWWVTLFGSSFDKDMNIYNKTIDIFDEMLKRIIGYSLEEVKTFTVNTPRRFYSMDRKVSEQFDSRDACALALEIIKASDENYCRIGRGFGSCCWNDNYRPLVSYEWKYVIRAIEVDG